MRKVSAFATLVLTVVIVSLLTLSVASAAVSGGGSNIVKCETIGNDVDKDGEPDNVQSFLSFPTWYRGLDCNSSSNSIELSDDTEVGTVILTVSLNIIDIALRLIGIMAVGFVIYGGFQYVISRGEPEHTKAALYVLLFRHCEPSQTARQSTRARA